MWCWKTQTYTCCDRGPLAGHQIYQQSLDRVHNHDSRYANYNGGGEGPKAYSTEPELNLQTISTIRGTAIVDFDSRAQP
jgi:hypothetical protein